MVAPSPQKGSDGHTQAGPSQPCQVSGRPWVAPGTGMAARPGFVGSSGRGRLGQVRSCWVLSMVPPPPGLGVSQIRSTCRLLCAGPRGEVLSGPVLGDRQSSTPGPGLCASLGDAGHGGSLGLSQPPCVCSSRSCWRCAGDTVFRACCRAPGCLLGSGRPAPGQLWSPLPSRATGEGASSLPAEPHGSVLGRLRPSGCRVEAAACRCPSTPCTRSPGRGPVLMWPPTRPHDLAARVATEPCAGSALASGAGLGVLWAGGGAGDPERGGALQAVTMSKSPRGKQPHCLVQGSPRLVLPTSTLKVGTFPIQAKVDTCSGFPRFLPPCRLTSVTPMSPASLRLSPLWGVLHWAPEWHPQGQCGSVGGGGLLFF